MRLKFFKWATATAFLSFVCAAAYSQQYTPVDLGTLSGSLASWGTGINNLGQVVGYSYGYAGANLDTSRAFLYTNGSITDLGNLGGGAAGITAVAMAINDEGEITGETETAPGSGLFPFIFIDGSMQQLSTDGGSGYAINDGGSVTGDVGCCGGATYAFVYAGANLQILGSPVGAYSYGYGINFAGEIVGQAGFATGNHAFAYLPADGTFQDLGTLGGSTSSASAINVLGEITGTSDIGGYTQAFLYVDGAMVDIGYLSNYEANSYGKAINAAGQVVGWSGVTGGSTQAAFLYSNGQMFDLNALLVSNPEQVKLTEATAINDAGWIVAEGTSNINGGQSHAYLLMPADPSITLTGTLSSTSPPTVDAEGNYQVTLIVSNTGNATASNVALATATLVASQGGKAVSTATATALPAQLYAIAPGASTSILLSFPSSAGAPGVAAAVRWSITDASGSSDGSVRLTLP